jgi:NAD(P)H-quinone oxidoreductase subunit 4L
MLVAVLIFGAVLFAIGLYGILSQTNFVMIMMGVEVIIGASMLNLVAFWRFLHPQAFEGQMFVLITMTVMALEATIGFGIATARFRARGSVESEEAAEIKE